jgi:hypothetical protein
MKIVETGETRALITQLIMNNMLTRWKRGWDLPPQAIDSTTPLLLPPVILPIWYLKSLQPIILTTLGLQVSLNRTNLPEMPPNFKI